MLFVIDVVKSETFMLCSTDDAQPDNLVAQSAFTLWGWPGDSRQGASLGRHDVS